MGFRLGPLAFRVPTGRTMGTMQVPEELRFSL
jgi:hypothetical protein